MVKRSSSSRARWASTSKSGGSWRGPVKYSVILCLALWCRPPLRIPCLISPRPRSRFPLYKRVRRLRKLLTLLAEAVLGHPPPFASPSGQTLRSTILRRLRLHRNSGSDLLQVANDDPVTFIHALVYDNQTAIGGTRRDNALLGPAVIADDVNEPAELTRTQRDLWHQQRVGLVGDVDTHMDELSRQQRVIRVADGRARYDRSRAPIDHVVEEGERTGESLLRVVRRLNVHGKRPLRSRSHDGSELRLARVEGCVNRVELDERIELRAGSVDQRSLVYQALAQPAGERCPDLGVTQLQLGGLYRCRIRRKRGFRLVKVTRRLV